MSHADILLDPRIKTHVLLPITIIMVLVHILQKITTIYIQPTPKLQKANKIRQEQHLRLTEIIIQNRSTALCKSEWEAIKANVIETYGKTSNLNKILEKPIENNENELTNPLFQSGFQDMMLQGMKGNLLNYLPQPILMFFMSFLFGGYIVLKLPFTLTANFKPMLQSSIQTPDLDVSYVTGISWYFVNLLGVESIGSLILMNFDIQSPFSKPELEILESVTKSLEAGGHQSNQQQNAPTINQVKPADLFKRNVETIKHLEFSTFLNDESLVNESGGDVL